MFYYEGELFYGDEALIMIHALQDTPTGYECWVNPVALLSALGRIEWGPDTPVRKITKKGVEAGSADWLLPWLRFESHIAEGMKDIVHLGSMELWEWGEALRRRGHLPYVKLIMTIRKAY